MNVRRPSQRSELAIDLQNRLSSRIGFTVRRDAGWGEIGLDSVMACAFLAEINAAYGCALTPEILHQHSTLSALATFLDRLGERRIRAPSSKPLSIAVIGMAGRFPDADTPAAFWDHLANGKCSVTPIPEERRRYWDPNGLAAREGSAFGLGAFLSDVECFDPLFFGISPKEAAVIDPQQRIFLEEAWKAFEDAGYAAPMLSGTRCGVYAGVMVNDYHDLLTQAGGASVHELMDTASFLPARIAYHLDLKGPALAVDTASSSSLVAIDLACRALAGGEVDLALAGGATLYLSQKRYILMEKAGMLTSGGKCRVFDTAADGMMPGEAVGVVVLKRLDDALRDRDAIHGVILASGTSQSGRTVGITAPSVEAQAELMETVYREGGIDPASITLVEAHGTGTRLGDPAEVEALTRAYRSVTTPGAIALGSLKANVGHSFAAAGVSGLIKILLAMKHRRLSPQIHLEEPQPLLAPGAGPFRLLREPEPWEVPGGGPRRAAICGVGFSGTNAHLVVEEAPAHVPTAEEAGERYWFILSAPEPKALERRATNLLAWMRATPGWSLPEVSFTLSTGRNALEERLAFRASNRDEAEGMLAAFLKGEQPAGCFRARAGKTSGPGEPHEWVHGADVDWAAMMEGRQVRRVHLPADPLDGTPYWYDKGGGATPQTPRPLATPATAARSGATPLAAGRSPIRLKPLAPVVTPVVPVDGPVAAPIDDVLATVRSLVARTLYLEVAQVREDRRFQELGFDSILAVDLAKAVGATFGIPFPAASLYDYPNVQALAEHLAATTAVKAQEPETPPSPPVPVAEPPVPGDGLAREVAALAAGVLYIDAAKVRPESRFADLGLDSILAVELARGIAARWQVTFSAAELYSYPTPLAVARFIQGSAAPVMEAPVTRAAPLPPPPPPVAKAPSRDEPLAIIGYAGRFPGAADAEAFWEQVAQGRSAIGDQAGRGWEKPLRGGWLDGIDRFDAPFFRIAPPEAEVMDPQHRLLLEVAWSALEHAGRTPEELAERTCGIFLGMGASDYAEANASPHALLGNTGSGLTARLAFLFDWRGPTMVVDTACASSLSALYLACRSLQNGECDAALVGGVHVASTPRVVEAAGAMGLLSPTGTCRTFDARADGFLIGEGVGAVLVKRLADAERDGDTIHGVIRAIGVSQDGARHGMSAPQASGQTRLQKEVYERAGVDPASLQYVELHGMSSTLSDEIELLALKESFAGVAAKPGAVALGSLKPNIGHPLAASGMAGLLKLLLALRHRQLPPVGGLETPNPALALETTPFRLPTTLCPWEGSPRRAALNGLSATGTNAHLVLEEAAGTAPSQTGGAVLLVLSARTRTALERRAAMLRDTLAQGGAELADVAWTLQVGRRAMEERLAFVARSAPEACDALARFLGEEGSGFTGALHTGRVAESDAMVDLLISGEEGRLFLSAAVERGAFDKLARLWVAGAGFDFRLLQPGRTPRRVPLPIYPFEGERYWHAAARRSGAVATTGPVATAADAGASLRDWICEALRLAPGELTESRSLNALGFGSLYAMSVAARYEAAYGVRLPLRLFYEARTVGDLCRAVSALHPVAGGTAASLPLSEGQKALWGLHFSDPGAYLLPVALRLEQGEPERIAAVLQSLVEEHPALRTTFVREEGEPVRRVLAGFEAKLEEASPGTLRELAARPLEMEGQPLWRATWLPRGSGGTLLCVFHHLIFDGQSLGLFLEAFHERLAVLERGGTLPRRPVVDDAPFFARESRYLESPRYREDRDWWLARHPGSWRGGLFPPRSGKPSEGGALWVGDLPAGLIRRLGALAERERVTLQVVMLAAFEAMLGAEPRELTLGIPVDLRPEAEAKSEAGAGPIGYFINLIALPSRWRGDAPFAEWCRERLAALLEALDHRAFPFRHLAQALATRDGGAPPALEVAFYFLTWPNATRRRHFEALERGIHQSGEFPLVAEVIEGSDAWRLHFKYQSARLDAGTVERLATTYLAILEAVAETPGRLLSTLPKPVAEPKTSPVTFPADRSIARLIEEQAGRTPDAVAAVFEGESLTYAALDAEANRWAHELVARGVKPGMLVGLLWPRSLEMLVGLLAIWKAGAAYVPLDPAYPAERIAMIVEDARLPFLLLPPGERGPEGSAATLLSLKREELAARPATPPFSGAEAEDRLAYVIFTSGSTGRPKGVQIAHRSLAHFLWCMAQRPGCGPGDRVLALTTISFDIAALELFLPLVTGARVEIVPESVARNGVHLREAIERIGPTVVQATPATWKMLLLAKLPAMPGLKALCGGEAWDETLAGELLPRVGELWNLYGPTETTIWSSIARVLPGEPVRLGESIGNTVFYVFDEALRPVPRGEIGELYIGGEGLAKGYLHRPDLTRERFIPHPERPGELIYRTGDLVRYV